MTATLLTGQLEQGLRQRVTLIEALRSDLLGPGRAIGAPLPEIIVRRYGWDCGPDPITRATIDLQHCPDGHWRVASQRSRPGTLLDAPVLAIFLPAIGRALLGRSLLLASTPSRWLDDPGELAALARDGRWQIEPWHGIARMRLAGPTRVVELSHEAERWSIHDRS